MNPHHAEATQKLNSDSYSSTVLIAQASPETTLSITPETIAPKPPKSTRLNVPVKKVTYVLRGSDCVSTLKKAGLLPNQQVTKDGYARTIPTKPLELAEGEKAVIKTKEGRVGHVLQVERVGDKLISRVEGGYPGGGVGRVVPSSVIVGEVSL